MDTGDFIIYIYSDDKKELRDDRLYNSASLYTGLDITAFKKESSKAGKPYFSAFPGVQFSITHSGGYWACAFGEYPVGLDLQKHRECREEAISKRFFHPSEYEFLKSCDFSKKDFFDLWSAKESYVKYTGEGLSGFETFSVSDGLGGAEFKHIQFLDNYSMCLCSAKIGNIKIVKMY